MRARKIVLMFAVIAVLLILHKLWAVKKLKMHLMQHPN